MKKEMYKYILFAITGFTILYFVLDEVLNGFVLDWLNDTLFISNEYIDDLGQAHLIQVVNWTKVKETITIFTLAIILGSSVIAFRSYDKKYKKVQADLLSTMEKTLSCFKEHDKEIALPAAYAKIESQLLQIRNQEEEQLRKLELQTKQKNDLISYLAHDMKTPLASVVGYLSLLNDVQDIPKEQQAKYLAITLDKAERLESLIDEFFDITRFNLHDMAISRGKIEMYFLFQQLREQFYPILIKQEKSINIQMRESLVYYGDADKLARAFNNILKNAISYSYEKSEILVNVEERKEELCISFHNKGDEIPQQKLTTIFEKFYRLDKARSTNTGGAGLGLAIAKEIIEAHQGHIEVESSLQETVFIVTLPILYHP